MLYAITTTDNPGSEDERARFRDGHLSHFKAHKGSIALSGPLSDEAGSPVGSLVVFEADRLADARAFIEGDPFFKEGVWSHINVACFKASIHAADMLS